MENFTVFDYEDIQLIPNKCIVNSRFECDTTTQFGKHRFKLPVVPANMQTVIDEALAIKLAESGYFYIMHRFTPESLLSLLLYPLHQIHQIECLMCIAIENRILYNDIINITNCV